MSNKKVIKLRSWSFLTNFLVKKIFGGKVRYFCEIRDDGIKWRILLSSQGKTNHVNASHCLQYWPIIILQCNPVRNCRMGCKFNLTPKALLCPKVKINRKNRICPKVWTFSPSALSCQFHQRPIVCPRTTKWKGKVDLQGTHTILCSLPTTTLIVLLVYLSISCYVIAGTTYQQE